MSSSVDQNLSADGSADQVIIFPRRRGSMRASGEIRVRQILDAAVRIIGTEGPAGLTHRSVARAAGVPLGSMTYYFTDREDLIRQAMLHAIEVESKRLHKIVDSIDCDITVDFSVQILTEMFFDKTVADPLYDLALFELFLEATRNPSVRSLTQQWSEMIAQLTDRVLPPIDPKLDRDVAVQLVATVIDGLMLEEASNQTLGLDLLSGRLREVILRLVE